MAGATLLAVACGGSADDTGSTSDPGTGSAGTTGAPATTTGDGTTGVTPTSSGDASTSAGEASTSAGDASTSADGSTSTTSASDATTDAPETTGDALAMSFFVSSTGSKTGNLGGWFGADERCQMLAEAVGSDRTWHAYLSIEKGLDDGPVHARDRIGTGPWHNANGVLLAKDLDELHALDGDADLFLDEHGEKVPGQWEGSPTPNEHDILTGSDREGMLLVGKTCEDWISDDPTLFAQIGHSDGLGPMGNDAEMYRPWNSVHENGGCHDTAPKGGAGRVYCFAID